MDRDSKIRNNVALLDIIEENCKHLTSIDFSKDIVCYTEEQRYVSFLCSFGHQLIRADMDQLDEEELLDVAEKCENLKFEHFSSFYWGVDDAKRMKVIGSRLDSFTIDETISSAHEWLTSLAQCTNLRILEVHDTTALSFLPILSHLEELFLVAERVSSLDILCIGSKT